LTSTPSPSTKRQPASTAPWSDLYVFLRAVSVALACGLTFFLRAGSATNFHALPPFGGSWYGMWHPRSRERERLGDRDMGELCVPPACKSSNLSATTRARA